MSLFEDSKYQYSDTFFVFFNRENRPDIEKIEASLAELGPRYETIQRKESDGAFESLTFVSPYDFSAMDIVVVEGEEVTNQITNLMDEFKRITLTGDEPSKISSLGNCDARFDIFHFERSDVGEEEALDPGGLLLVMEKLSELCDGIALDPQSHSLM